MGMCLFYPPAYIRSPWFQNDALHSTPFAIALREEILDVLN